MCDSGVAASRAGLSSASPSCSTGGFLRIVSTFVPGAVGPVRVFRSEVLEHVVLVSVVESPDGGASVNGDGQRSLEFLRAHQDANYPKARTKFVSVTPGTSVGRLVRTNVSAAATYAFIEGNALVFYGRNAAVCKLMLTALGAPTLPQ